MINITFTADPLPVDFSGSLQDFQERFLQNLTGTISEAQVLTGQVGGTKPLSNVGPWLNDSTWYVWDGSQYVPATVRIGGAGFTVKLSGFIPTSPSSGTSTSDKTQVFQDKDGVVALLDDVYVGRAAVVLSGTTPTIDWSLSHHFVQTLSGNTTVKMANSQDGQEITVALKNDTTSYTVSWPSTVFWPSGAPTQTASKTDLYIFRNIGGSIFGRQVPNY